MGKYLRNTISAGMILLSIFSAQANNYHEHFTYLPNYNDIKKEMGDDLYKMKASDIHLADNMIDLFGVDAVLELNPEFNSKVMSENTYKQLRKHLLQKYGDLSVGEVAEKFSQSFSKKLNKKIITDDVVRSFFELTSLHQKPAASYVGTAGVRAQFFKTQESRLEKIFENYIKRSDPENYKQISLSVALDSVSDDTLKKIRKLFKLHGGNVEYYMSVSRKVLSEASDGYFQKMMEKIKSKSTLIEGMDLTGSINEKNNSNIFTENQSRKIKERLTEILMQNKENNSMRIHAFEQARDGDFYDIFWKVIDESAKKNSLPKTVRIGHINEISESDLNRFDQYNQKTRFLFEANIESNRVVQSLAVKDFTTVASKIKQIMNHGYQVLLGSDGEGILGEQSTYVFVSKKLNQYGFDKDQFVISDLHKINCFQFVLQGAESMH